MPPTSPLAVLGALRELQSTLHEKQRLLLNLYAAGNADHGDAVVLRAQVAHLLSEQMELMNELKRLVASQSSL